MFFPSRTVKSCLFPVKSLGLLKGYERLSDLLNDMKILVDKLYGKILGRGTDRALYGRP